MAVQLNPMIFNRFKGIREYNGVNAENEISALVCENVELFNSEIGSEVGIKTIEGNSIIYAVNANFKIIGIFGSPQKITENSDTYTKYFFIYAEHITDTTGEDVGKLYYINSQGTVTEVEGATFTKTGQCNGLTMTSTAYDVFIFTNGIEAYSISFAETPRCVCSPFPATPAPSVGVPPRPSVAICFVCCLARNQRTADAPRFSLC